MSVESQSTQFVVPKNNDLHTSTAVTNVSEIVFICAQKVGEFHFRHTNVKKKISSTPLRQYNMLVLINFMMLSWFQVRQIVTILLVSLEKILKHH